MNKAMEHQEHLNSVFSTIVYKSNIFQLEDNMGKNDHTSFFIGFYIKGRRIYSVKIYVQEIVELMQETEDFQFLEAIRERGYIEFNNCKIWKNIPYQSEYKLTSGSIIVDLNDGETNTSLGLDKQTRFDFDSLIFDEIVNDMERVVVLYKRLHS